MGQTGEFAASSLIVRQAASREKRTTEGLEGVWNDLQPLKKPSNLKGPFI
jgi:hypothetical protein